MYNIFFLNSKIPSILMSAPYPYRIIHRTGFTGSFFFLNLEVMNPADLKKKKLKYLLLARSICLDLILCLFAGVFDYRISLQRYAR